MPKDIKAEIFVNHALHEVLMEQGGWEKVGEVPKDILIQLDALGTNNQPIPDLKAAIHAAQNEKKIYVTRAKKVSTELDVYNLKAKLNDIVDLFKDVVAQVSQSFFLSFLPPVIFSHPSCSRAPIPCSKL